MKTIWVTSLGSSPDPVKGLMSHMKTYGLEVKGHFWKNDLQKAAWAAARDELLHPAVAAWLILDSHALLTEPDTRYGLSLLAASIQARRGLHFTIVVLQTEGELISADALPTLLKGAGVLQASDPGLGAKLTARVHGAPRPVEAEYYMDLHCSEQIGQWFEIRPAASSWPGAMFGVAGAEIKFQAVGPAGGLPSKSVLNYPMEGLKLQLGEREYDAWAVQNELSANTSYFVKVEGFPESIIFGPYSQEQEADVFSVQLK